jgi:hypothetical protein
MENDCDEEAVLISYVSVKDMLPKMMVETDVYPMPPNMPYIQPP